MSEHPSIGDAADSDRRLLTAALDRGSTFTLETVSSSAQAYLAWLLASISGRTVVWITDGPRTLDVFFRDAQSLATQPPDRACCFPARESAAGAAHAARNPDLAGDRLDTLRRCRESPPPALIATCIQALLQPTAAPDALARTLFTLATGSVCDLQDAVARLAAAGYEFVPQVQAKGEASVRGGILDFWPPHHAWPVRAELFGESVESLRTFDPWEQRSLETLSTITVTPARETDAAVPQPGGLGEHLPSGSLLIWVEPSRLAAHAELFARAHGGADPAATPSPCELLREQIRTACAGREILLVPTEETDAHSLRLDVRPLESLPGAPPVSGRAGRRSTAFEPDALAARRAAFVRALLDSSGPRHEVHFFFSTEGARDRFHELFCAGAAPAPHAHLRIGALSEGFTRGDGTLTVVAESDLYGRRDTRGRYDLHARRPGPRRMAAGERITDAAAMEPGELVVHVEHGIGRYLGLYEIEFNHQPQEALAIEYAENAKLYVPVAQAHLLTRYVGFGRQRPELHKLGGARWSKERQAAEKAVRDLAGQLLETQALRQTRQGHAFKPDAPWQHEFEAAFPHEETDDQLRAIADVKRDMENARPMDRLICGDVGYGKTEVALRAAFKAVMDGKQVALLVPTTVLAQQHYDTFCQRLVAFPIAVEMLSRFRTHGEQLGVVRRLRDGGVDIVIGTHRLVQADVAFKDLGLVIIDEEQRFGVAHKEALKELRRTVDVLTLTATPIPRTLYLGLTGARDMSVIQTPPLERLPIETIVAPYEEATVREAILRELDREGQVFYLHNRVQTIYDTRDKLQRLVPEARIEAAHGQMGEGELAEIMHRFVRGEFDVLLCTTIIESGVDIPSVNTILIERADRFGLADLYQLRGRVGRYKHRAYAYLLLPRHGRLFDTARQRIGAIRRYSSLGAGFKLALRDLETRGAGNLLGAEQSGHIAAVGFDLYCQLLRRTVAQLKGEAPPAVIETRVALDFIDLSPSGDTDAVSAVIPSVYVEDEGQRLSLYRRLAGAATEKELRALGVELRDRFGPRPPAVERLLKMARIRILAQGHKLNSVETTGDRVLLMRGMDPVMPGDRHPRLRATSPDAKLDEILRILARL